MAKMKYNILEWYFYLCIIINHQCGFGTLEWAFYFSKDHVLFHQVRHVELSCFYSGPELTNQTLGLQRTFLRVLSEWLSRGNWGRGCFSEMLMYSTMHLLNSEMACVMCMSVSHGQILYTFLQVPYISYKKKNKKKSWSWSFSIIWGFV